MSFFSGLDEALQVQFYSWLMHPSHSRVRGMVEALLRVESLGPTGRHSVGGSWDLWSPALEALLLQLRERERKTNVLIMSIFR